MDAIDIVFKSVIGILLFAASISTLIGLFKMAKSEEKGFRNLAKAFLCIAGACFFALVINGVNGEIPNSIVFGLGTFIYLCFYFFARREYKKHLNVG